LANIVALIPARSGSKRISNKNVKELQGHPLIAYTINLAFKSGLFSKVFVSSDSEMILEKSLQYGDIIPVKRPENFSQDNSPDIEWVKHVLETKNIGNSSKTYLTILRPTNPLRSIESIQQAHFLFQESGDFDSLRAMQPVKQHPGKIWQINQDSGLAIPLLNQSTDKAPWHSSPTNFLPQFFYQDASLEITTVENILKNNSISGTKILGWVSDPNEGFDLNTEQDWDYLIYLLTQGIIKLPILAKRL
jgi:CMP-N,N'-diacetyllegionaminic acid synthase